MGKITYQKPKLDGTVMEVAMFTRMFNVYGIGEELLFPIKINQSPSGNLETNLATYLIKFKEFKKTQVGVKLENNKDGRTDIFYLFETKTFIESLIVTLLLH